MSKRSGTTTHDYLVNAPLPAATETYTVIPHGTIINKVRETLASKGFEIERELYRCNENAQVAQGIYHLKYGDDPDMGMMFAWSNSYDKTMRFKCSIGGYVHASLAAIIGGNMGTFGRKHTGTADEEVYATIENQINNAEEYFAQLIADKETMKQLIAPETLRAEFMGRAYFINELITGEQMAMVKSEFRKPSFEYSGVKESMWEMYNAIIYALQKSHPRTWMDQQRMIHYLICKDFGLAQPAKPEMIYHPANEIHPNQLNLLDAITEAEQSAELKEGELPCVAHALEQEKEEVEYPFKDDSDIVLTVERPEEEPVEVVPGLSLDEIMRQYPVTKEEAIVPEVETVIAPAETFLAETPQPTEEDGWPCMKCGEMQGPEAIFYDGQLCGNCYEH